MTDLLHCEKCGAKYHSQPGAVWGRGRYKQNDTSDNAFTPYWSYTLKENECPLCRTINVPGVELKKPEFTGCFGM